MPQRADPPDVVGDAFRREYGFPMIGTTYKDQADGFRRGWIAAMQHRLGIETLGELVAVVMPAGHTVADSRWPDEEAAINAVLGGPSPEEVQASREAGLEVIRARLVRIRE